MFNGFGFDIAAEFVNAFRARGVKVGFYYSLLDWNHPDYPVYDDPFHPQRDNPNKTNQHEISNAASNICTNNLKNYVPIMVSLIFCGSIFPTIRRCPKPGAQ